MNNEELLNENAELKAKIIKYAAINEQETKDYAELKAENETYKANADAVQKCITQNEQLKTYISGLEKKNAKLNAIIDGYQPKIQALKDEKDKYYQQTLDDEIQINELFQTLQEIKEFCKKEIEYFDNNDNYGQQADWIALLQKITKAEEEWK